MKNTELRDKFKKLYLDKFNIELTDDKATELFSDFINLMKVILKPDTNQKELTSIQNERSKDETIRTQQFR